MGHALVLNASFEPLHIVTWQRAMQLLFQGKVEVVEESDQEVRTVRFSIRVPAVLRLLQYVPLKQKKQIIRFSRTNIFLRDGHVCQYCGTKFAKTHLTLDHVIPIVQGGQKSWLNIVTACKPCNQKKGGRTPAQANLRLIRRPIQPEWLPNTFLTMGLVMAPERWKVYLKIHPGPSEDKAGLWEIGKLDPEIDPPSLPESSEAPIATRHSDSENPNHELHEQIQVPHHPKSRSTTGPKKLRKRRESR